MLFFNRRHCYSKNLGTTLNTFRKSKNVPNNTKVEPINVVGPNIFPTIVIII